MNERSVDLVKAYELISGGKLNKNGKSEINQIYPLYMQSALISALIIEIDIISNG